MQTTHSRLHPLLSAAAISVTVLSVVGVGTLTGLFPHSIGSQNEVAPLQIPQDVAKPLAPVISHPVKPVQKKPAARASTPRPSAPVAYNEFGQEPRLAQVETPRPAVQPGNAGTIQAVREVKDPGPHTALGPIAGGVIGAVLGDQIGGKGNTRKVLTVLGAAGGAYAGREVEKQARATKHWEIDVRRDDGVDETVRSDAAPAFQPGERIRVVDGRLQPA